MSITVDFGFRIWEESLAFSYAQLICVYLFELYKITRGLNDIRLHEKTMWSEICCHDIGHREIVKCLQLVALRIKWCIVTFHALAT